MALSLADELFLGAGGERIVVASRVVAVIGRSAWGRTPRGCVAPQRRRRHPTHFVSIDIRNGPHSGPWHSPPPECPDANGRQRRDNAATALFKGRPCARTEN